MLMMLLMSWNAYDDVDVDGFDSWDIIFAGTMLILIPVAGIVMDGIEAI